MSTGSRIAEANMVIRNSSTGRLTGAESPCATKPSSAGSGCGVCGLKGGCLPRGLVGSALQSFSGIARLRRKIQAGAPLFSRGSPLSAIYVVRAGTFKTFAVSRQGQSKITGFHLPGDILGLHALNARKYLFDAVALEESEVCVLPIERLEQMMDTTPALWREFVHVLSETISHDRRLLLMGCMDAEQRVSRLLLSLADRYQRLGYARQDLFLHMTRDDIASYLSLSSETVSRVISRLRRKGVIAVDQRHIAFTDAEQLATSASW
jgi:CRP/FNR family transcriptional regulator